MPSAAQRKHLAFLGAYRDWEATQVGLCARLVAGEDVALAQLDETALQMLRLAALLLPSHNRSAARSLMTLVEAELCARSLEAVNPGDLVRSGCVADFPRYKRALCAAIPREKE